MEYIADKDIWCEERKMPLSVHGFVCRKNGHVFMIINADLSEEAKREAIKHEFEHLRKDDLFSEENATEIEKLCTPRNEHPGIGCVNSDLTEKRGQ